ncbi:MAG: hypothetical protein ABIP46_06940, partial [Polaromonas sp.]
LNHLTALTTHSAPPVTYPAGRSRFQGWLLGVVWLGGLLVVALWLHAAGHAAWHGPLALATLVGAGAAAVRGWRNLPSGQLVWDGTVWRWESPGYRAGVAEHALSVVADFQHVLLLRLENQAHASLWLWVQRATFPQRWLDLRRAVYSPRQTSNPFQGEAHGPGASSAFPVDALRAES